MISIKCLELTEEVGCVLAFTPSVRATNSTTTNVTNTTGPPYDTEHCDLLMKDLEQAMIDDYCECMSLNQSDQYIQDKYAKCCEGGEGGYNGYQGYNELLSANCLYYTASDETLNFNL